MADELTGEHQPSPELGTRGCWSLACLLGWRVVGFVKQCRSDISDRQAAALLLDVRANDALLKGSLPARPPTARRRSSLVTVACVAFLNA
jgi:hypothetical protein